MRYLPRTHKKAPITFDGHQGLQTLRDKYETNRMPQSNGCY